MTTIQVNERTKAGRALIETARVMAEKYNGIELVQDGEIEDPLLLKKMLAARKSGITGLNQVMETLNGIIEKK